MKDDAKDLWRRYVVPSMGKGAARKLKGPHTVLGEGRDSMALTARWHGQPVVVKIVFYEPDYWRAADVLEADELVGVAKVLGLGQWISAPTTDFGYGVVVQERAWTPAQIQGADGPFTAEQASRLIRVTQSLDAMDEDWWPNAGADLFYRQLDVGLDNLSAIVADDGMTPVVADLHIHNVGLIERDGEAEAVILDFGVVQAT